MLTAKKTIRVTERIAYNTDLSILDVRTGMQLSYLLCNVNRLIEKFGPDATISVESDWEDDYECSVTYSREETDEELEKRLRLAAARKAREREKRIRSSTKEKELTKAIELLKRNGYNVKSIIGKDNG
jgi:hypothetical protein